MTLICAGRMLNNSARLGDMKGFLGSSDAAELVTMHIVIRPPSTSKPKKKKSKSGKQGPQQQPTPEGGACCVIQ